MLRIETWSHEEHTYIYVYKVAILFERKAYSLKSNTDYINYLQQGLLYLASNTYDLICSYGFMSL
jgi:hypothetical protein